MISELTEISETSEISEGGQARSTHDLRAGQFCMPPAPPKHTHQRPYMRLPSTYTPPAQHPHPKLPSTCPTTTQHLPTYAKDEDVKLILPHHILHSAIHQREHGASACVHVAAVLSRCSYAHQVTVLQGQRRLLLAPCAQTGIHAPCANARSQRAAAAGGTAAGQVGGFVNQPQTPGTRVHSRVVPALASRWCARAGHGMAWHMLRR